jgi:hypothetical protein
VEKLITRRSTLIDLAVVALLCALAAPLTSIGFHGSTAFINYFGHPNTPIGFHGAIAHIAQPDAKLYTD